MAVEKEAEKRLTMAQFVARERISMRAELTEANPNMADMPAGSNHWKCTPHRQGKRMRVPFSQGPAICKEPTATDVLSCLASDAASFENARGFEDWAGDMGYDTDSRKAEKVWKAVEAQSDRLHVFLGDEAYRVLLWHTDQD